MLEKVDLTKKLGKEQYKDMIDNLRDRLGALQRRARDMKIPVTIVFEGWDAAGKGTIVGEMIQSLDPRGFNVFTTHEPKEEELMHPYMWRFWTRIPHDGRIVIFDRSWYTQLAKSMIGKSAAPANFHGVFDDVVSFERQLADSGMLIIKFFLHISKEEQKKRMEKLQADKENSWRVTKEDWKNHHYYDKLRIVVEEMLRQTDTEFALWTIVEAHDKRFAVAKVMNTVINAMEAHLAKTAGTCQVPGKPGDGQEAPLSGRQEHTLKKFTSSILSDIDLTKDMEQEEYKHKLKKHQEKIRELCYACYSNRIPVIVVFEGWDAAGKGGCIRRLTQNMDHRGYTVIPVSAPTAEEKEYHYLWRFWKHVPKAGHIAVFDRSWYGRVLVERVEGFCREEDWRRAYKEINEMEEQWCNFGVVLVKFWLQIDKTEQKKRFEERMSDPERQWKLTGEDWRNREKWDSYENAVDEMFFRTSTVYAPWTVVEANSKYFARIKVLETVNQAIETKLHQLNKHT